MNFENFFKKTASFNDIDMGKKITPFDGKLRKLSNLFERFYGLGKMRMDTWQFS